ncbi:hypothetical protein B0I21_1187 [Sphingobacterium paludis]|uniref:Uncharacterized protein n=2 Tax=Sphingobacterium paludis TaxID=1476465 RepID=A0A4R7CSC6_9SPHI|nr:hypothetical protein B0I21_1187 [Sphingobacterium paludis]
MDEEVICYIFKSAAGGEKYLVWLHISALFNEWKNQYGLDDTAMLKFLLKAMENELVGSAFRHRLTTFKINENTKPIIGFTHEDYDLESYYLDIPQAN